MKITNAKDKLGQTLFFIGLIFLIISIYSAFRFNTFYYDELFSITTIKLPWDRFISIICMDVHPPLHYFILRYFVSFLTLFGITDMLAARFTSILAMSLLIILAYFKVRKEFGWLTFGIFTFCIASMPQFMSYTVDFRMYSWAMVFVTASFIYLYYVIKNPNLKNWIIFTILTICSAYTHYYAAISSAMIYFVFLIYIIFKNRELLKSYILSASACIIAYTPWIFIIKYQISRKPKFWIEPIDIKRVISYFYYIFSPSSQNVLGNEMFKPSILGTIFILAIFILIVYCLKNKNKEFNVRYANLGILIAILVPICGLIISFIKYPILHYRYLFPSLGCLWLGVSILVSNIKDKKALFIPILAIMLIVGIVGAVSFINYENDFNNRSNSYNQTVQNTFADNSLVFCDTGSTSLQYGYLLKSHENVTMIKVMDNYTVNDLKKIIDEHNGSVFYVAEYDTHPLELNLTSQEVVFEFQHNPYGIAMELPRVYKIK